MTINKYRANSLKAAIDKARADLGPEAKVVHVRQLDKAAVPGMESPDSDAEKIEIIAAIDDEEEIESSMDGENIERQTQRSEYIPTPTRDTYEDSEERHRAPKRIQASSAYDETFLKNLKERISEEDSVEDVPRMNTPYTRRKGNSAQTNTKQPQDVYKQEDRISAKTGRKLARNDKGKERTLQILHKCCSKNQVNAEIMYELLSLLDDERGSPSLMTPKDYMSSFIGEQIDTSGGLNTSARTAVLIGPTGVGKTTTLAKLAAQYHFQEGKNVGLITIDAYRIAAINQLKTYAQIMSIPLKVALTPKELEQCIGEYKDMDMILVDTPGRSQFNDDALTVLQEFLEAAQPADTHLLLTVSTKEDDAYMTLDSFAPEYVRQLIFTKIDETASFGSILNICAKIGKPVSYLTTGQNVPDDIEIAQADRMADLFLNNRRSVMSL